MKYSAIFGIIVSACQTLFLIAVGMMFYTCIVSPGYFAQQGKWIWLGMFSLLIILGIAAILQIM